MRQRVWLPALIFMLLLPVPGICGDDAEKSLQKQLGKEIIGKNLVIRNFYSGSLLKYDSGGTLTEGGKAGIWTIHGIFQPASVKLSGKKMEIRGKRLCWIYDASAKMPVYRAQPSSTKILVELTPEQNDLSSIREIIHEIFLADNEPIEDAVPSYWKAFLRAKMPFEISIKTEVVGASLQPSDVLQPPRQVHGMMPRYSTEARMAGISGIILLRIMVDEEGNVSVRDILRALGAGLEENAVEAFKEWKFSPALLNGRAVKTLAVAEVMFRLY